MSANDKNNGFSFSLGAIILIAICLGATGSLLDELLYSRNSEPIPVATLDEARELEGGDFVRITGKLDYDNALIASKAVGDDYLLAPVLGFHDRLWISIKNGSVPSRDPGAVTFTGRIEAQDGSEWEIGEGREIDLAYQAKQFVSAVVTDKTLVLRDGVNPGDGLTAFTWITGIIGAFILLVYLHALCAALAGLFQGGSRSDDVLEDPVVSA